MCINPTYEEVELEPQSMLQELGIAIFNLFLFLIVKVGPND